MIKKLFLIAFLVGTTLGMFAMMDKIKRGQEGYDPRRRDNDSAEYNTKNIEHNREMRRKKHNKNAEKDAKKKNNKIATMKRFDKKEINRGEFSPKFEEFDSSSEDN